VGFYANSGVYSDIIRCYFKGNVLIDDTVSGTYFMILEAGGLAGRTRNDIVDSYAKGTVTIKNSSSQGISSAGGIAGILLEPSGSSVGVSKSYAEVDIELNNNRSLSTGYMLAGGIAGAVWIYPADWFASAQTEPAAPTSRLQIIESYSLGDIDINSSNRVHAGGIAGMMRHAQIQQCHSGSNINIEAAVSRTSNINTIAGGIVGSIELNAFVRDCYSIGDINVDARASASSGEILVGGIAGHTNCSSNTRLIEYCFALGSVIAKRSGSGSVYILDSRP
jgi:hypothetical protein